jgi:LacI family transcriptional regulator
MATIYDVARESGFSLSTVSKVFNGYPGVSEKTRERVLSAAGALGYVPNQAAQSLSTKRSWLIGIVLEDDSEMGIIHPHFSTILQKAQRVLETAGYDIIFINRYFSRQGMKHLEHCRYRNVDGVILASNSLDDGEARAIHREGVFCVSVERIIPTIPTVLSDNEGGTMKALSYLFSLGHRKIAMIVPPIGSVAGQERYRAYRTFMEERGLEQPGRYVVQARSYSNEGGMEAADRLIEDSLGDMPTAVFAGYDVFAVALQSKLQKMGYRVPSDVSVIGFDDLGLCASTSPPLTTVRQNREEIGTTAARTLLSMLDGKTMPEDAVLRIPTELVIRDSVTRPEDSGNEEQKTEERK